MNSTKTEAEVAHQKPSSSLIAVFLPILAGQILTIPASKSAHEQKRLTLLTRSKDTQAVKRAPKSSKKLPQAFLVDSLEMAIAMIDYHRPNPKTLLTNSGVNK